MSGLHGMRELPGPSRRAVVAGLAGSAIVAIAPALAQTRLPRVGYLSWQDEGAYHEITWRGFVDGLRSQGFELGRNVEVLRRSASNDPARFKSLARELAELPVDVFFAPATPMATAAWFADRRTPIVVATILDPVELKFVQSLARPATRVTGVTTMNDELTVKRLQLLAETVPGLQRVGVVVDDAMRQACSQEFDHAQKAAARLGMTLTAVHVDRPERLDAAFKSLTQARVQAVISTLLSTRNNLERDYAQAALNHRLPSMFELDVAAREGGLMSYGPDFEDVYRRAGRYTARVLKGEQPAAMPMEEPREFRLVLNLRTARAIGLAVPGSVRLRADEVIE